jgi:hypothetical protein
MAIEVEPSPVARETGVLFVHDVDLADAHQLSVGKTSMFGTKAATSTGLA